MKRYLARLAERAATTSPPPRPQTNAGAIADPFETVAPPLDATPPSRVEPAPPAMPQAPPVVVQPPASMQTTTPAPPPETIEHRETLVRERIVEKLRPQTTIVERPLISEEPQSLQPPPPPAPEPVTLHSEHETVFTEEKRIIEERVEEQQLLRKADAFMEQLRERRPPVETHTETEMLVLEPRVEREPAPRLQPPPASAPVHEPAPPPEVPSLVIGNLTVEVLPSAPAPQPQRAPVIVVRGGGRGSARASFPSSRRFGMRQF